MTKKKGCLGCLGIIIGFFILVGVIGALSGGDNKAADSSTPATKTEQKKDTQDTPKVKTYKAGQYKVGVDLPAGEYVAIAKSEAYIEVAKDSKGSLDSILVNDIFINRSIISVADGQYLKIQNATLYAFADAPAVTPKDGTLESGMYKVGQDINPGEYKVTSEGGDSYIEVSASSRHTMGDIVSNDIFQGDKYVTLQSGQYVKFYKAKIKIN